MLIKERSYWTSPLTQRKWREQLLSECQHWWEKWRQKRREGRSREGVMEVHKKENEQETEVYLSWLFWLFR